jgi:hypothetical protein
VNASTASTGPVGAAHTSTTPSAGSRSPAGRVKEQSEQPFGHPPSLPPAPHAGAGTSGSRVGTVRVYGGFMEG